MVKYMYNVYIDGKMYRISDRYTKCEETQKTEISTIINSKLKCSFNPDLLLYR